MKNNLKKQKGFTLIELTIFMGMFSILILALFQLLISVFDVQLEAQSTASVTQDGRYILNRFTYDVKNSTTITSPNLGVTSQSLVMSDGTTTYTYSLSNGNLVLINSVLGTTDKLNSVNTIVSGLSFLRLSDTNGKNINTITFTFTLNSKTIRRNGANTENFKTTAGIRK